MSSFFDIRNNPTRIAEFKVFYGFEDGKFSFAQPGEDIFRSDAQHGLPVPIAAFMEGGVRVPFPDLLNDFLLYCGIVPTQLGLNSYRIVMGVHALNQILGTSVGVREILHHLSLIHI